MATAADIPGRYDIVIDTIGYQFLDTIEPSLPFRSHRAIYSYSPTFIERSNVSGSYGDNQQAFWLTAAQNDWSLGEQQRYFRQADATSSRRYWAGSNVNVTYLQGQASIESAPNQMSLSFSAITVVPHREAATVMIGASHLSSTDEVGANAAVSHGCSFHSSTAACSDGHYLYLADDTQVRTWDNVSFATFTSTTGSSVLAFANNTLFGSLGNTLNYFDSSGNPNLVFKWVSADGTSSDRNAQVVLMTPYGGQIMAVVDWGPYSELWLADTTGAQRVAGLPNNFVPYDICLADEIIFIGGNQLTRIGPGTQFNVPTVYYYANGNIGKLWQSKGATAFGASGVSVAPGRAGVMFNDIGLGTINYYDITDGGVSTIASYTENTGTRLAGSDKFLALTSQASTAYSFFSEVLPASTTQAAIQTSLFDFDSSLTKLFRGVTVDWANAVNGDDGGTVDLAYQVNDVAGSYTSLANSVVAGQEYTFPTTVTGTSMSLQVTLNQGTSTFGPILKKTYLRAAPELQTFRIREYVLDLSGTGFEDPVMLNDDAPHPMSGHEMAVALQTAITDLGAVEISDRFGTFMGILEPTSEIYEVREGNDAPDSSGTFVAKIDVREI